MPDQIPDRGTPAPSGRARGYGPTLVVGLLAATGVTVAVSRPWVEATAVVEGLPTIQADATGADLSPLAGAFGFVLLASFGAVIATRGWVRRGLGALVVVCSVVVLVAGLNPAAADDVLRDGLAAKGWTGGDYDTERRAWNLLAVGCAVACALAGAAVARWGAQWATMGSRYDAPTATEDAPATTTGEMSEADAWKAIDQGRDPTQQP